MTDNKPEDKDDYSNVFNMIEGEKYTSSQSLLPHREHKKLTISDILTVEGNCNFNSNVYVTDDVSAGGDISSIGKIISNGGITNSPLGDEINYFPFTMKSGGNYLTLNKGRLKDVFAVLGNESNYPIVIHCSIGTDRTGVICFLVNGLLGVSEEDLYKDYLFSNFGNIYGVRTTSAIKDYLKQINYASGDTLEEKFYNYLVNNGVNEEDLKTIIKIMKEDKNKY